MARAHHPAADSLAGFRFYSWHFFSLLAGVMIIYGWIVTHGTWQLTAPEDYGQFFDHLAVSLVHGRLDVPYEAVLLEAVKIDGHFYGGWGPLPALLRLPLALTGSHAWVGHTSRIYALAAASLTFLGMAGLLRELAAFWGVQPRHRYFLTILLAAGAFGSPLPFLLSHSYVFHESILWAGALAIATMVLLVRYLRYRSGRLLVAALLVAGAAGVTRPTLGCGALIGVGLILLREIILLAKGDVAPWLRQLPFSKLTGMTLLAVFLLSLPFAYNYLRFGTITGFPYDKYLLVTPERMKITHGGQFFHRVNLWPNFLAYFDPRQLVLAPHFPYFSTKDFEIRPPQVIDYAEAFASVGASLTGLLLLAMAGVAAMARRLPLLLVLSGALVGSAATCAFICLSERYVHDFFPALFWGAASGGVLLAAAQTLWARIARGLLVLFFALSAAQFAAFTFTFQQARPPTATQASKLNYNRVGAEVDDTVARIRSTLFRAPPQTVTVPDWRHLPPARVGTVAQRLDPPGALAYNGAAWKLVSGTCDEMVAVILEVNLPPTDSPTSVPLVAIGEDNIATILFLTSDGSGKWTAACDIWGREIWTGNSFLPPGRTFSLSLTIDRINDRIRIKQGATSLLDIRTKAHPIAGLALHVGENPFGGSFCAKTSLAVVRRENHWP